MSRFNTNIYIRKNKKVKRKLVNKVNIKIFFLMEKMDENIYMKTGGGNTYDVSDLNQVRETIEIMNKFNQIEILRILNKHNEVTLNENKYGVHINLTELSNEIIQELIGYSSYVSKQEIALHQVEQQKEAFKNTYFKTTTR
jgi:outer membrane translocation and assembly module TamA